MSLITTIDIFCDGDDCNKWLHGVTGSGSQKSAALQTAKDAGWKRKKVKAQVVDLCPECAAKVASGNEQGYTVEK